MENKYTVIWNDTCSVGSHRVTATKCARIWATIEEIMKSPYGERAIFIFPGWPLMQGCETLESEPITPDSWKVWAENEALANAN